MSTTQGCTDDSDVIARFKEALKQRVGEERFQIWFSGIRFEIEWLDGDPSALAAGEPSQTRSIVAIARGQFAADRLSKNYLSAMRGAAAVACGETTRIKIDIDPGAARQAELPFAETVPQAASDGAPPLVGPFLSRSAERDAEIREADPARQDGCGKSGAESNVRRSRRYTQSLDAILRDGTNSRRPGRRETTSTTAAPLGGSVAGPDSQRLGKGSGASLDTLCNRSASPSAKKPAVGRAECTWENFVGGNCNELARTACRMAIENPNSASPLVLWGPPGSGKTHLLSAVAGKLRGVHRMRRVVYLAAEEFTNDFIKALNANCLPAFRSRFRDADALLIDDIQFFVEKKATMRELHHTIEMFTEFGKPLVFAGTKSPSEIKGLGGELSGRLASGIVCQVESLDVETRTQILSHYAQQRCMLPWPAEILDEIAAVAGGDGRVLSGIVNLVALLQRMERQMPSMDQIRRHGGHLLRSTSVPITLSAIERAVEKVFQLDSKSLQSSSQTKSITEPRMLAMYLSRELTSSAFSEIGGHFGGRSHSTAILANQRVRQWLDAGRSIGRGRAALSADDAIRRIESMLKTG